MARRLVALIALALVACDDGRPVLERRKLASGRMIEVLSSSTGPGQRIHPPFRWLDYRSAARSREELLAEIREIWADQRQAAERGGIRWVYIEATSSTGDIVWEGLAPRVVSREKGCVTYRRTDDGSWSESPVRCCLLGPCEARDWEVVPFDRRQERTGGRG
jgi:hypothetical protein